MVIVALGAAASAVVLGALAAGLSALAESLHRKVLDGAGVRWRGAHGSLGSPETTRARPVEESTSLCTAYVVHSEHEQASN